MNQLKTPLIAVDRQMVTRTLQLHETRRFYVALARRLGGVLVKQAQR